MNGSKRWYQGIAFIMGQIFSKGRLIATTLALVLLAAAFLAGARHGYNLGYEDGESRTNGWWIDKKARYYESSEVHKKRIHRQHHHI
jgi:hypothetical protein